MSHPLPTDQQWLLLHEIDVNPSAVAWEPSRKAWVLRHGGIDRVVTGQIKRLQQLGYIDIPWVGDPSKVDSPVTNCHPEVNYDGKAVLQRRELVDVINRVNARTK